MTHLKFSRPTRVDSRLRLASCPPVESTVGLLIRRSHVDPSQTLARFEIVEKKPCNALHSPVPTTPPPPTGNGRAHNKQFNSPYAAEPFIFQNRNCPSPVRNSTPRVLALPFFSSPSRILPHFFGHFWPPIDNLATNNHCQLYRTCLQRHFSTVFAIFPYSSPSKILLL